MKYTDPFVPETGPLDPRLDQTVGRRGICSKISRYMVATLSVTRLMQDLIHLKKHISEKAGFGINGWGNLSSNNYRIMRYGMVLLWLAECEAELGNLESARKLVNQIRTRAANPAGFVKKAVQGSKSRDDYTVLNEPHLLTM
ncbi:RagB/SusD family nutrient uptake outer membrane protein [Paucibacter sp. O1-1]|nr:RagB/SusD family nutrient uptake outer membrane protein [Paucibacter sp. O1-1]MDA3831680.1 RagB/SusD family nutrient uptake outer membrane protein [Paucibacter sp. O1-1]